MNSSSGQQLPAVYLGWQVVDPGPPPRSTLINAPPDTPDPAAHAQWRQRVEGENAALERQHQARPVWFPVFRPSREYVIPCFGGRPATWQSYVATLAAALARSGFSRVRVANLSRHNVLAQLHQFSGSPRTPWATECAVISPNGSTVDAVTATGLEELTTVIVEIVGATEEQRSGMRTANLKQSLLTVGQSLATPVTLERLWHAVRLALTGTASAPAQFDRREEAALRTLNGEVQSRHRLRDDLDQLEQTLAFLQRYKKSTTRPPQRLGKGELRVRTLEVDAAAAAHEFLVGREIAAQFIVRSFARQAPPSAEGLIVAGADALSAETIDRLLASAATYSKQLILLFEHLDDKTKRHIGAGGSQTAVFFALPNAAEAAVAADHLGHEYRFVVNGASVSEGTSTQWSTTHTVSNDENTNKSINFGREFSQSISRGTSRGQSTAEQTGEGTSTERGTTYGRVHEYVIEPEQFQQLPDTAMLVIQGKQVTLGDCRPAIRALPSAAVVPYSPRR